MIHLSIACPYIVKVPISFVGELDRCEHKSHLFQVYSDISYLGGWWEWSCDAYSQNQMLAGAFSLFSGHHCPIRKGGLISSCRSRSSEVQIWAGFLPFKHALSHLSALAFSSLRGAVLKQVGLMLAISMCQATGCSGLPRVQDSDWLPSWLCSKESSCQCKSCRFNPWVGKIPRGRKWQPTPVFLLG